MDKIDKHALSLTLLLEGILLSTYRQESLNSGIKYFQGGSSTMHNLNATNISEIICTRLSEGTKEYGGAVGYLSGCFKRLIAREQSCDDKIRPDIARFVLRFQFNLYFICRV
jgi:hypothetical protein